MDDLGKIISLVLICVPLSLMSFGGGQTIHAGLQQQTVEVQHWLTSREFTDLFAISKTAPGPATLIVALIGWHIAGIWGALAGTVAIFLPSSLLICGVGQIWQRHHGSIWSNALEKGLMPVAVGLILAGAVGVARIADLGIADGVAIAATMAILRYTSLGPYPILAAVGGLYFLADLAGVAT